MKNIEIKWVSHFELEDKLDYLATQFSRLEFVSRAQKGYRTYDTYACYPL
jgi:hypothetical protein